MVCVCEREKGVCGVCVCEHVCVGERSVSSVYEYGWCVCVYSQFSVHSYEKPVTILQKTARVNLATMCSTGCGSLTSCCGCLFSSLEDGEKMILGMNLNLRRDRFGSW